MAIAHVTTIATISVDGTRSMAMVSSIARLANTASSPRMTSAKKYVKMSLKKYAVMLRKNGFTATSF